MEQITNVYREKLKAVMADKLLSFAEMAAEIGIMEPTLRDLIFERRRSTVMTLRIVKEYFKKLDEAEKK